MDFSSLLTIEKIKSIVTLDNFKNLVTFVFPLVASFFINKYSANRPKKLAVKEKQFYNVYLPLYKLICLPQSKNLTVKQLLRYDCKLQTVLNENYELVYPQLHKLSDDFHISIKNKQNDSHLILHRIIYQIDKDYELLKRSLGYPSNSVFSTLRRMNMKDRVHYISGHLCFPALVSMLVSMFFVTANSIFNPLISFSLFAFSCIVMISSLVLFLLSADKDIEHQQYRI